MPPWPCPAASACWWAPGRDQTLLTLTVTPWNGFWILFCGTATHGHAGHLREHMCKSMCPDARFQSALIAKAPLVITDDARAAIHAAHGPAGRALPLSLGDCIDVCNDVMGRMNAPKGLIRHSTENGVVHGWSMLQMFKRTLRPRGLVHGGLLSAASLAFAAGVALRSPFQVDVVKALGALARVVDDGVIENVDRLQTMNRTERPQTDRIGAQGMPGRGGPARRRPPHRCRAARAFHRLHPTLSGPPAPPARPRVRVWSGVVVRPVRRCSACRRRPDPCSA